MINLLSFSIWHNSQIPKQTRKTQVTKSDLEKLLSNSKVKELNNHILENSKSKKKTAGVKVEKISKEKEWLKTNLHYFCKENGLTLEMEKKFHPDRSWRFDFYIKELNTAIEYEGVFSRKSRHTTAKGFTGDTEKYNAAQQLGYKVLRYTAINYKSVIKDLEGLG